MKLHLGLDLDKIPDFGVSIDPGRYRAKLTQVKTSKSRQKQEPMLVWYWDIQEGYDVDQPAKYKDVPVRSFTTLSREFLGQLKQHLRAFGITGSVDDVNTDELIGREAILIIGKGTVESQATGEPVEVSRVEVVLPLEEAAKQPKTKGAEVKVGEGKPATGKPSDAKTVVAKPVGGEKKRVKTTVPTASEIILDESAVKDVESLFES